MNLNMPITQKKQRQIVHAQLESNPSTTTSIAIFEIIENYEAKKPFKNGITKLMGVPPFL